MKNVYLCIQCTETTRQEITTEEGTETEENDTTLFETKMVVAEGSVFESGKEYEFSKEITLPGNAVPSTNEETRTVVWEFLAGLDTKGNDPDSGWLQVNMSRVS